MLKYFKLTSGEDIIAELVEHNGDTYKLKIPVRIMLTQQGPGMIPWLLFGKSTTCEINNKHVLTVVEADDEMKNAYNERFGGGIVTATGPDLHKFAQ